MMPPVRNGHTNLLLGAPAGWDEERDGQCVALPVHRDQTQNFMHSFWQPTEADIANLLAGVPVRLTVFGSVHPPVAIAVTDQVTL